MNHQLNLLTRRKAARLPPAIELRTHVALADTLTLSLAEGWYWWHHPGGENRDAITGAKLKRMGNKPGISDFLFITQPHATLHALELKRRGKKPSPAQVSFLAIVRLLGGEAEWVDSYEDAIRVLKDWGAVRVSL
jgi:hypothetical protein